MCEFQTCQQTTSGTACAEPSTSTRADGTAHNSESERARCILSALQHKTLSLYERVHTQQQLKTQHERIRLPRNTFTTRIPKHHAFTLVKQFPTHLMHFILEVYVLTIWNTLNRDLSVQSCMFASFQWIVWSKVSMRYIIETNPSYDVARCY